MHAVRKVEPLEGYRVFVEFTNGDQKVVDLESLLRGPIFEPLKCDPDLFRSVSVDAELETIVWPNGADIDPDVLYGSHIPEWMEVEEAVA